MRRKINLMGGIRFLLLLTVGLWGMSLQAEAGLPDSPYITYSPGKDAFTTNAGDTNTEWYDEDTIIYTGVESSLRKPDIGEHFYTYERDDNVPVGKWIVSHEKGRCIHDTYPQGNYYYGVEIGKVRCFKDFYSGWTAYCADCDELIVKMLFYMSDDAAKTIPYLDTSLAYYYKCPHCGNLEQGYEMPAHNCKEISANRYYVRYHANYGNGYMGKSTHMYNDATMYEGREVTPQTTLNLNTYTRIGYQFTGWNTKADGSGTAYTDGATIHNLTEEENGSVTLYAQWEKCQSVLQIDPAGGMYDNKKTVSDITGLYGTEYVIDPDKISAPVGFTVHFDTKGGASLEDMVSSRIFSEWICKQPFHGKLEENRYFFLGDDKAVDTITAVYKDVAIILPGTDRPGYSFGGWYFDEECTIPAGTVGASFIPGQDTTLYACWVDLQLISVDNYTANAGKGAVNLSWSQKDNKNKTYQLYQRTDMTDWVQISSAEEKKSSFQVSDTISYTGEAGNFTIPYTGFYQISLYGAQGGNISGYSGGKGGMVQAVLYFEKGEKVSYVIGGQNGYSGGGSASVYGNGGGYSSVYTANRGTLLVAGGGGGASSAGNGGSGGSAAHVISGKNGENGVTGGGGGYQGGAAGEYQVHEHVTACRHLHTGNASSYGGCYTKVVQCNDTNFIEDEYAHTFYYGNRLDDGSWVFCVRCGSDDCPGHYDAKYQYICKTCGTTYKNRCPQKCTAMKAYALNCGRDESYICGMKAGQVLRSNPAYGGSNYINTAMCVDYSEEAGAQSGNGKMILKSVQIGMLSENYLNGVSAPDMAPPNAVDDSTITKTAVSEKEIRISFKKPEDNGTDYYHQVKSYTKDTSELLCTSNRTLNTLVSGVAGYRYVIDNQKETVVDSTHQYFAEQGERPFVVTEVDGTAKYLHIAAVDKAENIGPAIHVSLSDLDVIYWPLRTEKIQMEEAANIALTDETDTYYVKADGRTPFTVSFEGLLCGNARTNYQITHMSFETEDISAGTGEGKISIITPRKSEITSGIFHYQMSQLQKQQEGISCVQDASYTVTKRYNQCKSIAVTQSLTIEESFDGRTIRLTPQAAAESKGRMVYSERSSDLNNSIYLIADAKAPVIGGMDKLQNLDYVDYSKGNKLEVELTAQDTGSGLAEFYAEVYNLDNGAVVLYKDEDLDGKIGFTISEDETVFYGEFAIVVYAKDCVGNETSENTGLLGIGLEAYAERILEPHDGVYKRGESGILYIKALGYVEKIEVTFPEGFENEDGPYDRTYIYDDPIFIQTEELEFMVPFTVPDGNVPIQVKAYKAGTELEEEPQIVTIEIKGSTLDELRTRLR